MDDNKSKALAAVITSYSIHYTKLYEGLVGTMDAVRDGSARGRPARPVQ